MDAAKWAEVCAALELAAMGVKLSRREDGLVVVEEYQAMEDALQLCTEDAPINIINGMLSALRTLCLARGMTLVGVQLSGAEEQSTGGGDASLDEGESPSPTGASPSNEQILAALRQDPRVSGMLSELREAQRAGLFDLDDIDSILRGTARR